MSNETEFVRRAMAAWFRSGNTAQPSGDSGVYEADGRRYVELWSVNGTLAVYRIENSGRLKRLKRWPQPSDAHRRPMGYNLANNARDLKQVAREFTKTILSDAKLTGDRV